MNQKLKILLFCGLFVGIGAAHGHSCPALMHQIDVTLESAELSSSDKIIVNALRHFGEHQHKTGNHSDSVESLNAALTLMKRASGSGAKSDSDSNYDK